MYPWKEHARKDSAGGAPRAQLPALESVGIAPSRAETSSRRYWLSRAQPFLQLHAGRFVSRQPPQRLDRDQSVCGHDSSRRMEIEIAVAPRVLGTAGALSWPFERVSRWTRAVVQLAARNQITQPPSDTVRFVNVRFRVRLIRLEDPVLTVPVEEQPGMGGFTQHPSTGDLCRLNFLVSTSNVGMAADKPDLFHNLPFVPGIASDRRSQMSVAVDAPPARGQEP